MSSSVGASLSLKLEARVHSDIRRSFLLRKFGTSRFGGTELDPNPHTMVRNSSVPLPKLIMKMCFIGAIMS